MTKVLLYRLAKIESHFQRLAKSKHSGSEAEEKELFVSRHSKKERDAAARKSLRRNHLTEMPDHSEP
jgi:hypothetical protein